MVGKRVNILKYSVESIGNDYHHEKGHDHDHDHENSISAILSARIVGKK